MRLDHPAPGYARPAGASRSTAVPGLSAGAVPTTLRRMQAEYIDPRSGATFPLDQPRWCGDRPGAAAADAAARADADADRHRTRSLWRYRAAFPFAGRRPDHAGRGHDAADPAHGGGRAGAAEMRVVQSDLQLQGPRRQRDAVAAARPGDRPRAGGQFRQWRRGGRRPMRRRAGWRRPSWRRRPPARRRPCRCARTARRSS